MNEIIPANQDLVNRIKGVVTFNAPTYKGIAEDKSATQQAGIIAVVASVCAGLGNLISGAGIGLALAGIVGGLIGWLAGGWLLAFVAKQFFKGDTDTGEMLRVNGFSRVFGVASLLTFVPIIGPLLGLAAGILGMISNVIGIREAAGFDTTKAFLTALIAFAVTFVLAAIVAIPFGVGAALSAR